MRLFQRSFIKIVLFSIICSSVLEVVGQNPVSIQTLTFDSITARRGIWNFPSKDQKFRKILMYYTLKCDPATTADANPCGEWDYLTYNNVHVHTGLFDSNLIEMDYFLVDGIGVDSVQYSFTPVNEYLQSWQYNIVYDTIHSENDYIIGNGSYVINGPRASDETSVNQYLWRKDELVSAGLKQGNIDKIKFNLTYLGSQVENLSIRMKSVSDTVLNEFESGGFTEVYKKNTTFNSLGWQSLDFIQPFNWDSASSIIIEISYVNKSVAISNEVALDTVNWNSHVHTGGPDRYIEVGNGEYIDIPMSGFDFGGDITISFWCRGDVDDLPRNTSIFEARDSLGNRILNLHHPWNNSSIYWDAGAGGGYDRINKAANNAEIEGDWIHWAVTKDQATGIMRIYKNGNVWHSGGSKNRMIGAIDRFILGKSVNGNYRYSGDIDEFRVWNKALSTTDIQDWMFKDVDNTHPEYSDLVLYYKFDSAFTAIDHSGNGYHGYLTNPPTYHHWEADDIVKRIQVFKRRPQITLTQGHYTAHQDSILVTDTVVASPIGITYFTVVGRDFQVSNNIQPWQTGWYYTYGPNGEKVDSHFVGYSNQEVNSIISYYEEEYEIIERFEIGRFITPYGNGLDLGPQGVTWIYDVTDYRWLLEGDVDFSAGNNQELIDVRFDFIPGVAPREVIQMDRPWGQRGSKSYRNLDTDVSLPPVMVDILPAAQSFKMLTRLTGHGHNSDDGNYPHCCEWKDNTHYFYVDDIQVDAWQIWQTNDCAENNVFPQGGTWLGAREGWCPGDVVKDHEIDVTPFINGDDSVELDYDITDVPVDNQGMGSGNYQVAMHFFQYGPAAHQLDAEVYEVLSPNPWEYRSRQNPICRDAQIVIRNSGQTTLTSMDIYYTNRNRPYDHELYKWTGNLKFMETEVVTLPISNTDFWWDDDTTHTFKVELQMPNGQPDEYPINSSMEVEYNLPTAYHGNMFQLDFRTNNVPEDNHYTLKDVAGNVVYSRDTLTANTIYRDTFILEDGCYTLEFWDESNTGLYYWAWLAQGTNGYLTLRDSAWTPLQYFEREFGRRIFHTFFVGEVPEAAYNVVSGIESSENYFFEIFPNPTTGRFILETAMMNGDFTIEVTDLMGALVMKEDISMDGHYLKEFTLGDVAKGTYLVNVSNGKIKETRRLIVSD